MPEEEPIYIKELKSISFKDAELDAQRKELVVALHTLLSPLGTVWARMDSNIKSLKEYANDHIWRESAWTRNAIAAAEEIEYYKKLKEEETNLVIQGYSKMAKRLSDIDSSSSKTLNIPAFKTVDDKAKEILGVEPVLQLRKEAGKRSLQDELNKLFGVDAIDVVEDVITRLEGEANG